MKRIEILKLFNGIIENSIEYIIESQKEMEPMVSILILYNNKRNRIIVVYINRIQYEIEKICQQLKREKQKRSIDRREDIE